MHLSSPQNVRLNLAIEKSPKADRSRIAAGTASVVAIPQIWRPQTSAHDGNKLARCRLAQDVSYNSNPSGGFNEFISAKCSVRDARRWRRVSVEQLKSMESHADVSQ